MPGYIIHLTEAKLIVDILEGKGFLMDDAWKNEFYLGALLPDTKKKQEKISSHFWNEEDLGNVAIAPDMDKFMAHYAGQLNTPLMLGYWAHLHLDRLYVKKFWPDIFVFQNEAGEEKKTWHDVKYVHVLKRNTLIPVKDFFSGAFYYGDYSKSNHYLMDKYAPVIPYFDEAMTSQMLCPVKEVYPANLSLVLQELEEILRQPYETHFQTKVFDMEDLERFMQETASIMAELIFPFFS